jgi:hypothetical protein
LVTIKNNHRPEMLVLISGAHFMNTRISMKFIKAIPALMKTYTSMEEFIHPVSEQTST